MGLVPEIFFISMWLVRGHDGQLCSRIALLYLDIMYHCYFFKSIDHLVQRIFSLGLGNKSFMASHTLFFRDTDFSNVMLCGMPMSVFYHEDYLELCHQMTQQTVLEVRTYYYVTTIIFSYYINN